MKNSRRNLYYPIGLISLILLPITCFWYLNDIRAFKKERILTIVMSNKYWEEITFKEYGFRIHPKRDYIEINLTGIEKDDNKRLDFAELEIREFVKTQDTIKGIRFHFNDSAKYWTLIRAIDICIYEGANIFNLNDNDMWVFNMPKPKQTDIILHDCLLCGDVVQVKPKTNILLEASNNIYQFLKDNTKILILFLIFTVTTTFLFIKSRK